MYFGLMYLSVVFVNLHRNGKVRLLEPASQQYF